MYEVYLIYKRKTASLLQCEMHKKNMFLLFTGEQGIQKNRNGKKWNLGKNITDFIGPYMSIVKMVDLKMFLTA